MSGIAGFLSLNQNHKIISPNLQKMLKEIRHRGPDSNDFYFADNIGLAICSLEIKEAAFKIDKVLHNEDKSIFLICDGLIYNFRELRKTLKKEGHKFYSENDTEVIVHLYEKEHLNFCKQLEGNFALALWDRNKQQLILARDHLGVKPLYYNITSKGINFCSEIKSILATSDFKKEISFEALGYFLFNRIIPAPLTIFERIFSVCPSTVLVFKNNKVEENKYWQLHFTEEYHQENKDLVIKLLRKELEDSIKERISFPLPPILALSGGLDSTVLLSFMKKFTGGSIKTFYVRYPQSSLNKNREFNRVKEIVKYFKTDHINYNVNPADYLEGLEKIIRSFDSPISMFSGHYFISQLIQKNGFKVFFEGDGSEELFGGYWYHFFSRILEDYLNYLKRFDFNKKAFYKKRNFCFTELLFLLENYDWRFGQPPVSVFPFKIASSLLNPSVARKIKNNTPFNYFKDVFCRTTAQNFINTVLESDIHTFFPNHTLQVIDRLSMVNSIIPCSPFVNYKLFELSGRISSALKIPDIRVGKYVLKEMAKDLIPKNISSSIFKEGGGVPMREWLLLDFEKFVKSVLSYKRLKKHSLFNFEFVNDLINEHYSKKDFQWYKAGPSMKFKKKGADHTIKIWNLVMFQLWWEKYFG